MGSSSPLASALPWLLPSPGVVVSAAKAVQQLTEALDWDAEP